MQRLKKATKPAVLDELQNGTSDTIVLFAHSQYGSIRLPGGESITREELLAIRRDTAPLRTVVLVSCDTGNVDREAASIAEILLQNNIASIVIAPQGLVSATAIPGMLREFVGEGKTLNAVFNTRFYRAISKRWDEELRWHRGEARS